MSTASIVRIRSSQRPHPIRALSTEPVAEPEAEKHWLDDVRQFLLGWAAGLVFFGTFIA